MSGMAGIVNLDGAPVSASLVNRLEEFLHSRGPDGQGQWVNRNVALVHTLFATTEESRGERQPMSLDGQTWIVADARVDAREDLIRELASHGRKASKQQPDADLILHAYAVWGEQCVEHLLGDFAFAIWDARERKLFCARDHFGVRPFFYAHVKGTFLFSNSLTAPLLHPDVPDDLYEPAIGNFLVVGTGYDLERTVRAAVRRLPPAHVLIVAGGEVRTRRYWTLPVDPPTVFRRSNDYVERFLDLYGQAVTDRLRTDHAAVLMSGGMDSSSVAAMAKRAADRGGARCSLSAHTQSYHRLVPYEEGPLAKQVAERIGIPWNEFLLDDGRLLGFWDRPAFRRPEPWQTPLFDWTLADVLGNPPAARVVLTGQGGDGVFSSLRLRHCRDRVRQLHWLRLGREICQYLASPRRLRRLYIFGHVRDLVQARIPPAAYPSWLNPDFEHRLHLRERYEQNLLATPFDAAPAGAVRPEAHGLMSSTIWPGVFEECDADNIGACLEVRHPFFDLRLVRYAVSLPALPWCADKELLRRSMRGLLPEGIRLRRKRPILTDLLMAHHRSSPKPWLESFEPELSRYVHLERAKKAAQDPPRWQVNVHLRPVCLNCWLKWEGQNRYKLHSEEEFRVQN